MPTHTAAPVPAIEDDDEDEEIDENDPLWKATLKLAKGNREEALKHLEDPDTLMAYPEVAAALAEADTIALDENTGGDEVSINTESNEKIENTSTEADASIACAVEKVSSLSVSGDSSSDLKDAGDDEAVVAKVESGDAKECDPREHLNMVFIGHVDAGKSTLSGSIYILWEWLILVQLKNLNVRQNNVIEIVGFLHLF